VCRSHQTPRRRIFRASRDPDARDEGAARLRQHRRPRGRGADPLPPGRGLSGGWFSRGESGGGAGERCWVVDPIDGTNNFLHGLPLWGVSIAYAIAGEPLIGLIYLPCHDRLYSAARGGGAWCDGVPIHISRASDLSQAMIAAGISRRTSPDLSLPMIETVVRNGGALRCMGSCVVALAMVAEGTADGYFEAHVQAWDCLAGILIVCEAGGRTNEVPGPIMLARGGPLLASAPTLFDRLTEVATARLDLAGG